MRRYPFCGKQTNNNKELSFTRSRLSYVAVVGMLNLASLLSLHRKQPATEAEEDQKNFRIVGLTSGTCGGETRVLLVPCSDGNLPIGTMLLTASVTSDDKASSLS